MVTEPVFVIKNEDAEAGIALKINPDAVRPVYTLPPETGILITKESVVANVNSLVDANEKELVSITKPVILSPVSGKEYNQTGIHSTQYACSDTYLGKHTASDWEVATDFDFNNIEVSSYKDSLNKTTFLFTAKQHQATYYARVRYRSDNFLSAWSSVARFTSSSTFIGNPVLTVSGDQNAASVKPTFYGSAFETYNTTDTHQGSMWVVSTDAEFKNVVYSSGISTTNLLSLEYPNTLLPDATYYARVMYFGDTLNSSWSDTMVLKVGVMMDTPILVANGYVYEGGSIDINIINYDSAAKYDIYTTAGEYVRNNDIVTIKVPNNLVIGTEVGVTVNIICSNATTGKIDSFPGVCNFTILNYHTTVDQSIRIDDSNFNSLVSSKSTLWMNLDTNLFGINNNIKDSSHVSTISKFYINNKICDIKAGEILTCETGETFAVKTVEDDGAVASIYDIVKIVSGMGHVLLLTANGDVYAAGKNDKGQLGLGDKIDRPNFVRTFRDAKDIGAGYYHSIVHTVFGNIKLSGYNIYGQLGNSSISDSVVWIGPADAMPTVKSFSAGLYHTAIILDDGLGTLMVAGGNTDGQLCSFVSTGGYSATFVKITTGIDKVVSGQYHVACKTTDGYYAGFGRNLEYQLGMNITGNRMVFTKSTTHINDVWASSNSTYITDANGVLYCAGLNADGQLGTNDLINKNVFVTTNLIVDKVYPQMYGVIIKTIDGIFKATGRNTSGELLIGTKVSTQVFTNVTEKALDVIGINGYSNLLVTKTDKHMYGIGLNSSSQFGNNSTLPLISLTDIYDKTVYGLYKPVYWVTLETNATVVPDHFYRSVVQTNMTDIIQNTEDDDFEKISTITTTEPLTNILNTMLQSTADKIYISDLLSNVKSGNKLLINDGTVITVDTVSDDGSIVNIPTISKMISYSNLGTYVVMLEDGSVYTCGSNWYGSAGTGNIVNSAGWNKLSIIASDIFNAISGVFVVRKNDGKVFAFGGNGAGQLGVGNTTAAITTLTECVGITNPTYMTGSGSHSVAIGQDGRLYSTGYNTVGQLCLNNTIDTTVFTPTSYVVKAVACSYDNTLFISIANELMFVGRNANGQAGLGNTIAKTTPTFTNIYATDVKCVGELFVIKKLDGLLYYAGLFGYLLNALPGTIVTTYTQISGLSDIVSFEVNESSVYAINTEGYLYTFGNNLLGKLCLGTTSDVLDGFHSTGYKCKFYSVGSFGATLFLTTGKIIGFGYRFDYNRGDNRMYPAGTPITLDYAYPLGGSYKVNKWITVKETLANVPTAIYPLANIYFNGIEAIPNTGIINNGVASVWHDDIELPLCRSIETKVERQQSALVTLITANLEKIGSKVTVS